MRITGEDFFRAMARFHVRATPPTSPLLFEYGRDFPDFIESYEYAQADAVAGRTWRGSSAPGSTPITPPMPSRWRRRPWPRSLRSGWPRLF